MLKQTLILLVLGIGAVLCQEAQAPVEAVGQPAQEVQAEQVANAEQQAEPEANKGGFVAHLKDFASRATKGGMMAYEETKPALANLKTDVGEKFNAVKKNKHVAKASQTVQPHLEKVYHKASPLVEKIGGVLSKVTKKARSGNKHEKQEPVAEQNDAPVQAA